MNAGTGVMRLRKWAIVPVLAVGAILRLISAIRSPLEFIEADEFIPGAMTLSWDHHPIRLAQHGAVPHYLIRASSLMFGDSTLGFRMLGVVAGTATILLIYLIASRWWGRVAGLSAASLLAVERYHTAVSARAIDLPFDLFFIALAMFCFSRFLHGCQTEKPSAANGTWLYGAAVATGLGFLCKEFTALLVPVFFLTFILTRQVAWLRRRETWFALALFALTIAPDFYSNLTITPSERMELFDRQEQEVLRRGARLGDRAVYAENGSYMSYGDQLSRFRSVGFNPEPFYFYFGEILDRVGVPHENTFGEFPYMYPIVGLILWLGLGIGLTRRRKDPVVVFSLTMFFVMFVPFALVELGDPRATFPTDPEALWYWVDRTMLPALLLTGWVTSVAVRRLAVRALGPRDTGQSDTAAALSN